jgi:hypothetical protein
MSVSLAESLFDCHARSLTQLCASAVVLRRLQAAADVRWRLDVRIETLWRALL